jgi:hypothetical protein
VGAVVRLLRLDDERMVRGRALRLLDPGPPRSIGGVVVIRCTGLRTSSASQVVGTRCRRIAPGRVRRVHTERGMYIDGPLCGRCWRGLLASDAGPLAAATDPYAPAWVLNLVVAGGASELTGAVAARGSSRLPRSVRRRLAARGVRVPSGVGVLEVARWARTSRHGDSRGLVIAVSAVSIVLAVGGVVAAVVMSDTDHGAQGTATASASSVPLTNAVEPSTSPVVESSSSIPASADIESGGVESTLSPGTTAAVAVPTTRAAVPSATTTAPTTTTAPVMKTVSVPLGAGCTRVAYEAVAGVLSVVLSRDGLQVASGSMTAEWSGSPSAAATWTARLTVAGSWSGAFQWEGC